MSYDPFEYIEKNLQEWPEGIDPIRDVVRSYEPTNPGRLIALLCSTDEIISQRGLAIFGELGKKAFGVLDYALALVQHRNANAKSHLLDGVLSYPPKLTAIQLSAILVLLEDSEALIRSKMVTVLATVETDTLSEAISQIPEMVIRSEHQSGFQYFLNPELDAQAVFDRSLSASFIQCGYMLASLERRVRDGVELQIPKYVGDSFVHESLLFQLRRIARKN